MVGHVALVTEQLLVRTVLAPTLTAGTVSALTSRVVLTPVTVWLLHAGHALPVAIGVPLTRVSASLNTEDLVHKLHLHLLRSISGLPATTE